MQGRRSGLYCLSGRGEDVQGLSNEGCKVFGALGSRRAVSGFGVQARTQHVLKGLRTLVNRKRLNSRQGICQVETGSSEGFSRGATLETLGCI